MAYMIVAKKRDIPLDYWKHTKINTHRDIIHFDNLANSLIQEIYKNESINTSNGIIINYKRKIFIVTCYHGIKDTYDIKIKINDMMYNLNKVFDMPDFDLSIMKFENDIKDINLICQ